MQPRFRNLSPSQIEALNVRPYPGYPEYLLLDVPHTQPATFRRGARSENLHIPEHLAWQRFLRDHYLPPERARLLVLHNCAWGKPYDLSATLQPVVELCRPFQFVHRVIVSNVGLIPAELQVNPAFCAYDWIELSGGPTPPALQEELQSTIEQRARDYLGAVGHHYSGVLILLSSDRPGVVRLTQVARAQKLPVFFLFDDATLNAVGGFRFRTGEDAVRHPAALLALRRLLDRIAAQWQAVGILGKDDAPPPLEGDDNPYLSAALPVALPPQ